MNLSDVTGDDIPALRQRLVEMIARINTVFEREHQADGVHKLPAWIPVESGASDFAAPGGQTWTVVPATMVTTLRYWKHGTSMRVAFWLTGTTVAGTPQPTITLRIPAGATAAVAMSAQIYLTDAGAVVAGEARVAANGTVISFARNDGANFTGGATAARGSIEFEVTA